MGGIPPSYQRNFPMKFIYWNLRGIANDPTQNILKRYVQVHNPEVLCISEPFVSLDYVHSSFWRSMNFVSVCTNDRGLALPNLWIFCKDVLLSSIQILSVSDQHVSFSIGLDSVFSVFTAVYAKTTIAGRQDLWSDISEVKRRFVAGPWLVFGDFNAVLGAHEKKGGAPVSRLSCMDFQNMSDACELMHVDTKGAQFTWARRKGIRGNVELRLDRCLANLEWSDAWDQFGCSTLPRLCSDHNPLLMTFSSKFGARQSIFRFRKMWIGHHDFHSFVANCWSSISTHGCRSANSSSAQVVSFA